MIMKAIHCSLLAALALKLLGVCYGCKISEYPCKGGASCVPLDKYCDGRDDCGDGNDEPKMCTVCNRTYYGDIGRTYTLTVPPPQWNRLPFLCHLTFTASGHEQGDIVQVRRFRPPPLQRSKIKGNIASPNKT
uniref:CUB domain-containing protein n=1 Tax=Anopheles stephensi TaxID=30069 RepID=A0A182Y386_ANOST